jgi:4-hydroxy-2-oxoheptanedioate aldolase
MAELPRLNGVIKALEEGQVAFVASASVGDIGSIQAASAGPFDGVLFDLEHSPYDIRGLSDSLQWLFNPRQIVQRGSVAPKVTPLVRIPPNRGGGDSNWVAKQVLDIGVYGVLWPHIDTVEDAYRAVAAMRYPKREGHPLREPFGRRGDAPGRAITYWGVSQDEYYARADVWPLDPVGEIFCGLMIESPEGIKNLPKMLDEVQGISAIITGEGDLSQELGFPRQYDHPEVLAGVREILDICKARNVPNGWFHTTLENVDRIVADGYRYIMSGPGRSYSVVEKGRTAAGRT